MYSYFVLFGLTTYNSYSLQYVTGQKIVFSYEIRVRSTFFRKAIIFDDGE